jgi:hypothetical protein
MSNYVSMGLFLSELMPMRHTSKRETRKRDVILIRLRRCECIIYILIGFAYECIDMYIKPNTTAEVVCPYNGTRQEPII